MNILHAQICYYPPQVGRTDIYEYAKSLDKLNNNVFVLVAKNKIERRRETINNIRVLRAPINTRETFINSLVFIIYIIYCIFIKIPKKSKVSIDILHIYTPFYLGFVAIFLVRILNIFCNKKIKTIFDIRSGTLREGFKRKLNNIFLRIAYFFVHKTIVLDKELSKEILNGKAKKLSIVPLGVNMKSFYLDNKERLRLRNKYDLDKTTVFISVGSLDKRRRLKDIIYAFKKLIKTNLKVKLFFVGDGNDRKNLELITKINKLEKHIIFTGIVNYKKIPAFLSMADVGIAYIPLKKYFMHQPPLKTAEYLSIGLPVIATKTPGNKVFIKDNFNGILINDNVESLFFGFLKISKNVNVFNTNARKSIKKYDWDNIVKQKLYPIYKELIES